MGLRDELPTLLKYVQSKAGTLDYNAQLFEIYEGDLAKYVLQDLKRQLSNESFMAIQHRIAPINVLKRIVDKLSKIYATPPARWLEEENQSDQDLFDWYAKEMDVNTNMSIGNEFFNAFKNTFIEPYVNKGRPSIRIVPSDRFLVYSTDPVDPTVPTHYIKLMGEKKKKVNQHAEKTVYVYYIYTKDEFLPVDSDGHVLEDVLAELNNPDGINPYGALPGVYVNRSRHSIIPVIDSDTLRMTKIIPVLLSDLNFAVMYQAFSIIYGIDVDDQNIKMSPNAFWRFKSDPTSQNKSPSVGVIKPQVDIAQVMGFIMGQLSFWLQSKNIRPGQVGTVTPETFSSGVSKLVDEMDTFEDRQKQVPYFVNAEREFWDLLLHHMHPIWVQQGLIDEKRLFTAGQQVNVQFAKQIPQASRPEILAEVDKELTLQLITRSDAIMRLNPEMSDEEVKEYIAEINSENAIQVPGADQEGPDKHVHTSSDDDLTGPDVPSGAGHYHELEDGGRTSTDEYGDGHTHSEPSGKETGPPQNADKTVVESEGSDI